jgi:hypothetical protein
MLLDGGSGVSELELFDISSDENRPHLGQVAHAATLAPGEKLSDSLSVRRSGIFVANVGEEEFNEPPGGVRTGTRNDRWYVFKTSPKNFSSRNWNECKFHERSEGDTHELLQLADFGLQCSDVFANGIN